MTGMTPAAEIGLPSIKERRAIDTFLTRYADCLAIEAEYERPDATRSDHASDRLNDERNETVRLFLSTPCPKSWTIWRKLEIFERVLGKDDDQGDHALRECVWMWGCIKADIMRFGFGGSV